VSELFFREARKLKVQVYSADYGEEMVNSSGNETQVLIRQILAALSQWEKSQIVKKLTAGRRKKKSETGVPCGGPRPYGYRPGEWGGVQTILALHRGGSPAADIAERMTKLSRENPLQYPKPNMKRKKSRFPSWTWHPYSIVRLIEYWNPRVNIALDQPR
jgi:DNA invertase Pin-like site-specific DNA recombinase